MKASAKTSASGHLKKVIALVLTAALVAGISGCGSSQISSGDGFTDAQQEFEDWLDEMFLTEVVSDTLTLHYTILNPSDYGIDEYEITLGDFGSEMYEQAYEEIHTYYGEMEEFDYDSLTYKEQLTYDVLEAYFETELLAENLYLYKESLSPSTGVQAELPVLLAEYTLNSEQDITDYLELLKTIPDYFDQIIEFENEKSEAGLFMADFAAEAIISQCESFADGKLSENCLVTSFNERIGELDFLSDDEIKEYKKKNKKIVKKYVIPAYESLIDGLTDLMGTGENDGGLCGYEDGSEYYEYLVKNATGSDRTIGELAEMIENELNLALLGFYSLLQSNEELYDEIYDYECELTDPEDILNDLIDKISDDFPEPVTSDFTVKSVPESLEDDLSPAFYLTAPIDDLDNNVIYINESEDYEGEDLYSTLAHEGYPGHLYQTTYFSSTSPHLIRELLGFSGYSEGWGTYAEIYSYSVSDLDEDLSSALAYNTVFALAIYSRIDIGVNYEGWDLDETAEFLSRYYSTDDDINQEIYERMIEEPANYLSYFVGYLEFKSLGETAEEALGSDFSTADFHEFILETGPAPFYVIEEYMQTWIDEQ